MVAISAAGQFFGVKPPKIITGQTYLPTGFILCGGTYTTAVNDRFYFPFYNHVTTTYTGMKTYNQGVGDNGETLRLGVYNDDAAAGGPGTLVIDAGEITLSGAAALRTLASSFSLTGGKWYWQCYAANTAAAMFAMSPMQPVTAAAYQNWYPTEGFIGHKLTTSPNATSLSNLSRGLYVSTAYGALPANAVAGTSETSGIYEGGSGAGMSPLCGIYV